MAGGVTSPNIKVTADAGSVPVEMAKVVDALDAINAKPLDVLRKTTEDALNRTNSAVADTVDRFAKLKQTLADTGGIDNKLYKQVERDLARFQNLNVDKSITSKLASGLEEVRVGGLSPAQRAVEDERKRMAARDAQMKAVLPTARPDVIDKDLIYDLKPSAIEKARQAVVASPVSKAIAAEAAKPTNVAKTLDETKAVLDAAARQSAGGRGSAMRTLTKDLEDAYAALKKLRADADKGIDVKVKADDLRKKITDSAKAAGKGGGGVAAVGGTLDDLLGGKLSLQKGAKFGLAGLAASFAADALGNISEGLVKARDAGGGFEAYTRAVAGAVPIVGGLLRTQDSISELITGDKARLEDNNRVLALQNAASDRFNASLKERNQLSIETARAFEQQRKAIDAMFTGGTQGQVFGIEAAAAAQRNAIQSQLERDLQKIESTRKDAVKGDQEEIKRILARRGRGGELTADDRSNLQRIQGSDGKGGTLGLAGTTAKADADFARQKATQGLANVNQIERDQIAIATGASADYKAISDRLENIAKTTRTLDADPIAKMRREFEELGATGPRLAEVNKVLADYKTRSDEIEKQQRRIGSEKGIAALLASTSTVGLNPIDAALTKARDDLAKQPLVADLKVRLESDALAGIRAKIDDEIAAINAKTAARAARTDRGRIEAQVAAEAAANERATGKATSPEDQKRLVDARLGDSATDRAAARRESLKSPADKLREEMDRLAEEAKTGLLTADELKRANAGIFKNYADAVTTSRPEAIVAGSTQDQISDIVRQGGVADASNPELEESAKQSKFLERLVKLAEDSRSSERTPVRLSSL